jgi:tetratricopeptide (TPR) repeat protein
MQRLAEATATTNSWVLRYPEDPLALLYRARTAYVSRLVSRALVDYEDALKLQPDFLEAHLQLAGVLMVQSHFDRALPHYEECLKSRPDDATALIGAANCQMALGNAREARKSLEVLFTRHSETLAGCLLRGKLELAEDRPAEALAWLKRAESLSPHEVDVLYQIGLVLRRLGKGGEAENYERRLESVRADNQQLDSLRRQVKQEPDNVDLRYQAGKLALRLGREEAAGWLRSALQIDPNHTATHQLLADYYRRQGEVQQAEEHEARIR